jgi:hypothetical protein
MRYLLIIFAFTTALSIHAAPPVVRNQYTTNNPTYRLTNFITVNFEGGGATIQTNVTKYLAVKRDGVIRGFAMLSDTSTLSVVDIMRCTYAEYDAGATHPVIADKITASLPPTIGSSLNKTNVTSVATWSANITNGNVLAFRTITNTSATSLNLVIQYDSAP